MSFRAAIIAFATGAALHGAPGLVTLQDEALTASFDGRTGALVRLADRRSGWEIEKRPELAKAFRLLAPLPGRRQRFIDEGGTEIARVSDQELRIRWKVPQPDLTFSADITLHDGALRFATRLENRSAGDVETVDYPILGDLQAQQDDETLRMRTMRYDNLASQAVYPNLANKVGYWGVFYPTQNYDSSFSLFALLQGEKQGMYVQVDDPTERYLVSYTFEQHPGVPKEVHRLEFRTCHFVFVHPGATCDLTPIVLRPYQGDWHAGVDCYKSWRKTWYRPAAVPAWVRDVHSWQQIQINTPEQNRAVPYRNLDRYGDDCAANGVKAIQLVGWNHGGQDGGNPSQDTDPSLGTWQELHDAITRIQAKGVKIVLFGKFTWADKTTEWYRKEGYRYASTDPYGIPYETAGDEYLTPTQLAGINTHRFAIMDFLSPAYRGVAGAEFQKILALGSAGWLYDEVCDRTRGEYNFAPGHGYTAPGYIYSGAGPLARELRAAADRARPDFLFAGEGPQDWLTQYYPLSYFRGSATPVERYIDPQAPILDGVFGYDDREKLNSVLLNRYLIEYEPRNFKGRLGEFPLTLAYGKKIDAFRTKFRAWLWDADFQDTLGATVTADGPHQYSVFRGSRGRRAVVLVNSSRDRALTAAVAIPGAHALLVASPEVPEARPMQGDRVSVPARSAVVVLESVALAL